MLHKPLDSKRLVN